MASGYVKYVYMCIYNKNVYICISVVAGLHIITPQTFISLDTVQYLYIEGIHAAYSYHPDTGKICIFISLCIYSPSCRYNIMFGAIVDASYRLILYMYLPQMKTD